jgi:hypothetical protein
VAISPRPTPADQPTVKPVPVKPKPVDPASKSIIINGVPFISQAPLGHWSDPLQANGCEEASVLMAVAWARGLSFDPNAAEAAIIAMGEYQIKHYGQAVDTDLADTLARLLVDYWDFDGAQVHLDFSKASLIKTLESGQLIILPANGRLLGNSYFTPPGPTTHMLVISGYDPASDQFITQDPGTRRGANFRYAAATVLKAAVNYPTGNHEAQDFSQRGFISVAR